MCPSSTRDRLKGLYAILDERWATACSLVEVLKQLGEAGVSLVQYRNKDGAMQEAYVQAMKLRDVAETYGILFIVNDRCDLALSVEADGVHLGQSDLPLDEARDLMGADRLIGISTHRAEEVLHATSGGADYLGFGPIFGTMTKTDHEPVVGLEGLRSIRALTSLPIFAIGGITPTCTNDVILAGANGIAVASAILDSTDRPQTVTQFISAFQP
ncbi:MAG: thiamine phosphate synthase [Nitrospirales bacterium]